MWSLSTFPKTAREPLEFTVLYATEMIYRRREALDGHQWFKTFILNPSTFWEQKGARDWVKLPMASHLIDQFDKGNETAMHVC